MPTTTNEVVLITGGSRGLGKDMALQLAQRGKNLIITYRAQKEEAEKVVAAIRELGRTAVALALDTEQSDSFDAFAASVKASLKEDFSTASLSGLINNAGTGAHSKIADTAAATLDQMYRTHLKGPFLLTQKLLPLLGAGASVINVSSGLSRFSYDGYAAYAMMKGAIDTLTRYQAKEFGPLGIRVNVIAPGAIETDFGGGVVRDNKDLNAMIAGQTALGRVGKPDDIGSVAAFLCSEDAKWVNGQRIEVSGGIHL